MFEKMDPTGFIETIYEKLDRNYQNQLSKLFPNNRQLKSEEKRYINRLLKTIMDFSEYIDKTNCFTNALIIMATNFSIFMTLIKIDNQDDNNRPSLLNDKRRLFTAFFDYTITEIATRIDQVQKSNSDGLNNLIEELESNSDIESIIYQKLLDSYKEDESKISDIVYQPEEFDHVKLKNLKTKKKLEKMANILTENKIKIKFFLKPLAQTYILGVNQRNRKGWGRETYSRRVSARSQLCAHTSSK